MNDYTRREEVRWTLIPAAVLVVCVATAVGLLVTAKGPLVPDPAARATARGAATRAAAAQACNTAAERLAIEIDVFRAAAKAARIAESAPDAGSNSTASQHPIAEKAPDEELAWPAAVPSFKQAKALAPCRLAIEQSAQGVDPRPEARAAWNAIAAAAAIPAPVDGDKRSEIEAARKLYQHLGDAEVRTIVNATREAFAALKISAEQENAMAEGAMIHEPLPKGVVPRDVAIVFGVALSLFVLLLSYISLSTASRRRMAVLIPLRQAPRAGKPGLQAAAILRLAAEHNAGEPGLVMGSAIGGLLGALLSPLDADLFAGGVMGGLILGVLAQLLVRAAIGFTRWRAYAGELADVEKPAIAIVLVLSGVRIGLEGQFIAFFEKLSDLDAGTAVEKLATQAEEMILAAADAAGAAGIAAQGGHGGHSAQNAPVLPNSTGDEIRGKNEVS